MGAMVVSVDGVEGVGLVLSKADLERDEELKAEALATLLGTFALKRGLFRWVLERLATFESLKARVVQDLKGIEKFKKLDKEELSQPIPTRMSMAPGAYKSLGKWA